MKEKENIQEFWLKKENEKNSKLVITTACEYLRGYDELKGPIYGLLYLMENGFYFENFEEHNFMKDLFLGNKGFEKINITIKLNEIDEVKTVNGHKRKKDLNFFSKIIYLFGFTTNILIIKMKNGFECYFKCIESPLNICEKFYQLL
jgi:hypothetical protein